MKPYRFASLVSTVLFIAISSAAPATDTVKYESVLYVYRTAAFPRVILSKGLPGKTSSGQALVFSQPATVNFDEERLVLEDGHYAWNGRRNPPSQFKVTGNPSIITVLGQAATIRAVVPIQYLEKMPDGSLQIRTLNGDLNDMPHYQFTLNVRSPTNVTHDNDLVVSCQMNIATVQGREKIPGVELEVGRPLLAHFDQNIEYEGRKDEWSGLLIPGPSGSDYSLLMLLKVSLKSAALPSTDK